MTTNQLKIEIQNVIDEIPENILEDVLTYLKGVKELSESNINLSYNLSKIIREDKELLEKLA
jgi:hypothetical protein